MPDTLKAFLIGLATDAEKLGAFMRAPIEQARDAGLDDGDVEVLMSGDPKVIHARLGVAAAPVSAPTPIDDIVQPGDDEENVFPALQPTPYEAPLISPPNYEAAFICVPAPAYEAAFICVPAPAYEAAFICLPAPAYEAALICLPAPAYEAALISPPAYETTRSGR